MSKPKPKLSFCRNCQAPCHKHFCSRKCQGEDTRRQHAQDSLAKIQRGEEHNPRRLRGYLLEILGNQCQECKNTTWQGKPIPLDLEHLDGNGFNDTLSNLTLICPNCHALTPTYKAKNKGKGRTARRKSQQTMAIVLPDLFPLLYSGQKLDPTAEDLARIMD